jgi:hypothetical protein
MVQESISFARDIRPMFREVDVQHMRGMGVMLDDHAFMSERSHAESVLGTLTNKKMPPGGPFWEEAQLDLLRQWIDAGCPP